jgi:hypothetical protein
MFQTHIEQTNGCPGRNQSGNSGGANSCEVKTMSLSSKLAGAANVSVPSEYRICRTLKPTAEIIEAWSRSQAVIVWTSA